MGAQWSRESPKEHCSDVAFDPYKAGGDWWVLAQNKDASSESCQRMTVNHTYDPQWNGYIIRMYCWVDGRVIQERLVTSRFLNSTMPVKMISRSLDATPPEEKDECFYFYHTDYDNYAIIGSPRHRHLWVLSRKERVPSTDLPMLLREVQSFGYDTSCLMANPLAVDKVIETKDC